MNRRPQLGLHPDADQLAAFVERALTEAEHRQTLAHIAACSRCRQIVYLSQETSAELDSAASAIPSLPAALFATKGSHLPWFRDWRFAWIGGPALAVALLLVVSQSRWQRLRSTGPTTTASLSSAIEQQVPVSTPAPPAPEPQSNNRSIKRKSEQYASAKLTAAASTGAHDVFPLPAPAMPEHLAQGPAGSENNPGMVSGMDSGIAASAGRGSQQQNAAPSMSAASAAGQSQQRETAPTGQNANIAIGGQLLRQNSMNKVMSARAASPPNETVGVAGAAGVAASVPNSLGGARWSTATIKLPNGQLAVSTAAAPPRMLAIDAAGNLFLSVDAGAHWQSVPSQWTGHAVTLRYRGKSDRTVAAFGGAAGGGVARRSASGAAPAAEPSASTFELVTDEGKVWSSGDGNVWEAH